MAELLWGPHVVLTHKPRHARPEAVSAGDGVSGGEAAKGLPPQMPQKTLPHARLTADMSGSNAALPKHV